MRLHNLPATWNALMLLTGVQEVCSPEHEADRARVASTAQIYGTQLTRTRVCGDAHVELLTVCVKAVEIMIAIITLGLCVVASATQDVSL